MIDVVQWGGLIFIGLFYPIQNGRLLFTRQPIGISFLAFSFLAVGIGGYALLGFYLELWGVMIGNILNAFFCATILWIVWKWSQTLSSGERDKGLLVLVGGFLFLAAIHLLMPRDVAVSVVGWVGMVGIIAFYPVQNYTLFKKKDPAGLSLVAFSSLVVGLALYTILGFLVGDLTIILGNGASFFGTVLVLFFILRGNQSTEKSSEIEQQGRLDGGPY